MDEIKGMAEALGRAILTSTSYREYLELAKKMREKPQLIISMNRLKEMQADMAMEGQEGRVSLEHESKLCDLYSEISIDKDAIAFWHSERSMLNLLQDSLETIAKHAPINILGEYDQ